MYICMYKKITVIFIGNVNAARIKKYRNFVLVCRNACALYFSAVDSHDNDVFSRSKCEIVISVSYYVFNKRK